MNPRRVGFTILLTIAGLLLVMLIIWFALPGQPNENNTLDVTETVTESSESSKTTSEESQPTQVAESATQSPTITTEKEILNNNSMESDVRMYLFLGIDRTEERDETLGIYRSDSIAVLRIDMANEWAKVLSIPRDTYAFLPIRGIMDKINHAYAFGSLKGRGEASVMEAVNGLIGEEEMRHYFTLEMEPIADIVDSMDGIYLDVETEMKSHGADLDKGPQLLDGEEAYDYVHWRYGSDGDIGRIRRQQQFAEVFLDKLILTYGMNDISQMILNNSDHINTNILVSEITDVMHMLAGMEDVQFYTVPGRSVKIDGIYYWQIKEAEFNEMLNEFYSEGGV